MSKGGTTSGSTEIPAWLENAAIENINKARDVSQIGYVPYYGPDVAAFSPMQQQSMQSTGNAASAFGLAPQGFNAMAGMPQAQTFAGGVQGYSSAPLYEQSLDKLFANAPAQYNAMRDMVIDPFTGARSRNNYGNASPVMGMARSSVNGGGDGDGNGGNKGVMFGGNLVEWGNDANMAHLNRIRTNNLNSEPLFQAAMDGGTGYYSGGEKTGMQTNLMTGDEYEAYVLAHGLPPAGDTFMDGLRGFGRKFANNGLIGSLYEAATGNPIMQRDIDPSDPNYYETIRDNEANFYPLGGNYDQYAQSRIAVQEAQQAAARQEADIQAAQRQIDAYNQRGDMYPPQIQGGLLGNSPYQADGNEQALAHARMLEDIRAAQEAEANAAFVAEQQAKIDQIKRLTAPVVSAPAPVSTVNSNGDGEGERQREYAQEVAKSENRRQQSQLNLV